MTWDVKQQKQTKIDSIFFAYAKDKYKNNFYLGTKVFLKHLLAKECQEKIHNLGDNCTQNFHLGRYIVGYTVGNLVLRRRASGAVKRDFRTYIRRYTSPNENFEYGYPHSNALMQFDLKLERCKPHKAARHQTKGDVIDDVKLFPTVYRRIYCRKFLTLSNQTSRYKRKCIRIIIYTSVKDETKTIGNLLSKQR